MSLQHIGLKGYDQLLKESYLLVEEFVMQVKKRSYIELASEPDTNLCCFRGRPKYLDSKQWDQWNLELQQYLLNEERFFSPCQLIEETLVKSSSIKSLYSNLNNTKNI